MGRKIELKNTQNKTFIWLVNFDKVVNIISPQGTANKTVINALHIR